VTQQQLANLRPFQPGNPGGPGRPVGSRTAFSAGFLRDLAQVWQEHGRDTMVHTAKTQPATFFAVCARLIGPEVKVTIEQSLPGNLSAQDWQVMREIVEAVKLAVPNASSKPPGEVLEYGRARLSALQATLLGLPGARRDELLHCLVGEFGPRAVTSDHEHQN
jgi:hypothetical protein